MALLKFKRSAVPAKVPALNDLALGELAINTYDGKVYTKKDNGTASIVEVGASSGSGTLNVANGGTGATTLTSGYLVKGNGTSAVSASVVYDDGTNVGINCTATALASYRGIELAGAATTQGGFLRMRTSDSSVNSLDFTDTNGRAIVTTTAHPVRFGTSDTERMRINSSGNLLVGKTSTASSTTTDGFMVQLAASGGGAVTYITNGGTGSALAIGVQADTNTALFFRSGTLVGSISVTGSATAYNTSSDYRLKDIDGPIANSGAYIDALKPVQGSWKVDGSRFIGLLAHEVQEVSETPITTGEKDGEEMQALDYSAPEIIANLIAEIQSLRARVAQLEGN